MCDAKKSWPLYIFVLEARYRQEKRNYIQKIFITLNGLFFRGFQPPGLGIPTNKHEYSFLNLVLWSLSNPDDHCV